MSLNVEQAISSALKRRRVSSSANLEGFVIDARHFLNETGPFTKVSVKKTGNPRSAIVIMCSVADPSLPIADVVAALEHIWTEELAYGGPEQHHTHVEPGRIEMRFMSESELVDLLVTGRIVVDTSTTTGT